MLGTTTLDNKVDCEKLTVDGAIPTWISGMLFRTGPAKFEVGSQKYRHWFDGLAMIHKYHIKDGAVTYSNKYLESNSYKDAMQNKEITYGEFATDPCRSIFKKFAALFLPMKITDNANVNTAMIDGKYVAMTETTMPIAFDPESLDTLGHIKFPKDNDPVMASAQTSTAHPHSDKTHHINFLTVMGMISRYVAYKMEHGTAERIKIGEVKNIKEPSYMHSFALTENYIIFTEFPFVVSPIKIRVGANPFIENFVWRPKRGTRFTIISRKDGTKRHARTDAFFAFHHVNAFEKDGDILVDIVAYENPDIISNLYLDVMRGDKEEKKIQPARIKRYTIHKDGSTDWREISKESIELPRINYERNNTREYNFVYGVGNNNNSYGVADCILKINISDGSKITWSAKDCYPGEPVFIAHPDNKDDEEDRGAILSVVLDKLSVKSFLLVLDSHTFEEKARAYLPHHVPFSFHGNFFAH